MLLTIKASPPLEESASDLAGHVPPEEGLVSLDVFSYTNCAGLTR